MSANRENTLKPIWVIPYSDQPAAFWEELAARFGNQIRAVYFPMPGGAVASGRPAQPDRYMDAFLRQARLPKSVLVNPIVLDRPVEQVARRVVEALQRLRGDFGVTSVTVTSASLARRIKESLPDFSVGGSTLMGIHTPAQVLMVKDFLDFLVPDNRLVRDLAGLRRLRQAYPGELRLIVNEACLPGCPYRTQHFYEMAYSPEFPQSLCRQLLDEQPWLRLTGAWVLPRHLDRYDGLYDSLKIAGRVTLRDPQRYFKVLEAYVQRRDLLPHEIGGGPASILDPMAIPDELFDRLLACDKNCLTCQVCRNFYKQALAQAGG